MLGMSQCTFWCSALSDLACTERLKTGFSSLNAPSGAQCFPTFNPMHTTSAARSQCTFWCSVLSDLNTHGCKRKPHELSQCTFWCSVLSDIMQAAGDWAMPVSMHLLVLSAFRLSWGIDRIDRNAVSMHLLVLSAFRRRRPCYRSMVQSLNAPSGAQCFPTRTSPRAYAASRVSMHLLVLSAFRHEGIDRDDIVEMSLNAPSGAQCFPTGDAGVFHRFPQRSQCTFWCSVLSDSAPRKPRHNAVYRNEIAADLESTTSNRPAPVQLNHTTAKNRHKPPSAADAPYPPIRHRLPTNPSQKTDPSRLRHGKRRNQGHR